MVQDSNYSEPKTTPLANAECYQPVANSVNTAFIFPETLNTSNYAVYDRNASASSYTLTLPTFYDTAGVQCSYVTGEGSITFGTVSGDLPGFVDNTPVVTTGSSTGYLNVSWSASSFLPAATSYDVYYTSGNRLTGTYTVVSNVTSPYTITGLNPNTLYYVRVVPKDSYGQVGYSQAGSAKFIVNLLSI